jgi:hypothetical protein
MYIYCRTVFLDNKSMCTKITMTVYSQDSLGFRLRGGHLPTNFGR